MADSNFVVDKIKSLDSKTKWIGIGAAVAAILLLPAGLYYANTLSQKSSTAEQSQAIAPKVEIKSVAALGRLEPLGETIKVSAPSSQMGAATIEKILVKEGDKVTAGQPIAILDNRERLAAAVSKAQQDVKVAKANLAKVKAGVTTGEIDAQKAEIARLESQLSGAKATFVATKARLTDQLKWEPAAQAAKIQSLQVQLAGEKPVQLATVRRIESQLSNVQRDYQRLKQLNTSGAIATTQVDAKRLEVETAQQQLAEAKSKYNQTVAVLDRQIIENQATKNQSQSTISQQLAEAAANYNTTVATTERQIAQAKATLSKIAEIRPVDVQSAQAQIASAQATTRQAQAELDRAYVRAPRAGEILKIRTRAGEIPASGSSIVDLGQTSQMVAVAEIYESDIAKVKVGQTATITSESGAFSQAVRGTVSSIGLQIGKKDVLSTDPAAATDSRVVEVKVAIDPTDSKLIKNLTNSQVAVKINT